MMRRPLTVSASARDRTTPFIDMAARRSKALIADLIEGDFIADRHEEGRLARGIEHALGRAAQHMPTRWHRPSGDDSLSTGDDQAARRNARTGETRARHRQLRRRA